MTVLPPHQVLSHYPAASMIQTCHPVADAGFSGARIWRVETLAGPCALRRWPDDGLAANRLQGLHALLQHLQDSGLTFVAVPLRNRAGSTITRHRDAWWQLEPWLPGTANDCENPSRPRLATAMQSLARWHDAARTFVPNPAAQTWFAGPDRGPAPAIVERAVKLRDMLLRISAVSTPHRLSTGEWSDVFQRLLTGCRQRGPALLPQLEQACTIPVPLQVCLRDVWRDHVLYTDDEVTGLIDPSAARIDTVAADLARLLGSLIGDGAEAWDFALAEYRQERPLAPAELRLVPLLDQSGVVLSAWTWIEQLSQPVADLLSPPLLLRLRAIAERLEHAPKTLFVLD